MVKIKEITKEELLNEYNDYLTVGDIKNFLLKHKLPDDAKVVIQRVEDKYYDDHNWGVYLKKGYHTSTDIEWNENINGKFLDEEKYPKLKNKKLSEYTTEELKETMEQYTPAFQCAKYKDDDNDVLFINLHY